MICGSSRVRWAALCLTAALMLPPSQARAQTELVIDNDLFGLRGADAAPPDYEYTHGTALSWDGRRGRWGAGQRIYTPRYDAAEPIPGERPYAGWLYGSWERITASERTRTRLRIEAGVTGRPSLAEPVQNGLHHLAGYRPQQGWEHQLGFEPGVVTSYGREHRIFARGADRGPRLEVLSSWTVRAGNVRTGADAGVRARLRFGAGNAWTGAGAARGISAWVEAGGKEEAVLRDLFLDGNTFTGGDPSVERRTWVAQGEGAFGVRYRRTELEYRFFLRGREYETQQEPHRFGSIRLRLHR